MVDMDMENMDMVDMGMEDMDMVHMDMEDMDMVDIDMVDITRTLSHFYLNVQGLLENISDSKFGAKSGPALRFNFSTCQVIIQEYILTKKNLVLN